MADPDQSRGRWYIVGWMVLSVYLLFVALFAAHVYGHTIRFHYAIPYTDDWRILDQFFSRPLADWLFASQNGHRVPITLFLFYLDYTFFSGRMHLMVGASLLLGAIALLALIAAMRVAGDRTRAAAAAFAAFALLWSWACHDFIWGTNLGTVMAVMCLMLAMLAVSIFRRGEAGGEPRRWRYLILAAVAALIGTFSQAIGFAIWPSLIAVAIVCRLPAVSIVIFVIGAALTLGTYLGGTGTGMHVPTGAYVTMLLDHPWRFVLSTAGFIGAPVARILLSWGPLDASLLAPIAQAAGLSGLALYAVYTLSLLLGRSRDERGRVLSIGLMTFSVMAGAMVAINRPHLPDTGLGYRFFAGGTIFWIGAVWAAAVSRSLARRERGFVVLVCVLAAATLASLPAVAAERARQAGATNRLSSLAIVHALDIRDDRSVQWAMLPSRKNALLAYRVAARLRQDRRSFFSLKWTTYAGKRVDELFTVDGAVCHGRVERVTRLDAGDGPAARVGGWFSSGMDELSDPEVVLIVDDGGIIRGIGQEELRPSRRTGLPIDLEPRPWAGFVADFDDQRQYDLYSLEAGGRRVCKLTSFRGQPDS